MDMVCDKSFSTGKYMLLDHEKVGVVDLVQMLHSIDIKKRNFVDCPNDMIEKSFKRRWLLSMSVLAQKILKSIAKPLAATGSAIEHWLNLVSCNGNLGGLIWNSIRGEMIQPDITSATFISFIGNLDTRVELDKTIVECGDRDRYISLLSVMAAKASYENHAYLQHTVTDIWKIVDEEPNKNYFSLLSAIPKLINAGWEIIRSFVIPYTRGADYSEGLVLKMYRLIGLMIAGVPAHGLQDYVNAVRIRSELYKAHSILSNITTKLMIEDGTLK